MMIDDDTPPFLVTALEPEASTREPAANTDEMPEDNTTQEQEQAVNPRCLELDSGPSWQKEQTSKLDMIIAKRRSAGALDSMQANVDSCDSDDEDEDNEEEPPSTPQEGQEDDSDNSDITDSGDEEEHTLAQEEEKASPQMKKERKEKPDYDWAAATAASARLEEPVASLFPPQEIVIEVALENFDNSSSDLCQILMDRSMTGGRHRGRNRGLRRGASSSSLNGGSNHSSTRMSRRTRRSIKDSLLGCPDNDAKKDNDDDEFGTDAEANVPFNPYLPYHGNGGVDSEQKKRKGGSTSPPSDGSRRCGLRRSCSVQSFLSKGGDVGVMSSSVRDNLVLSVSNQCGSSSPSRRRRRSDDDSSNDDSLLFSTPERTARIRNGSRGKRTTPRSLKKSNSGNALNRLTKSTGTGSSSRTGNRRMRGLDRLVKSAGPARRSSASSGEDLLQAMKGNSSDLARSFKRRTVKPSKAFGDAFTAMMAVSDKKSMKYKSSLKSLMAGDNVDGPEPKMTAGSAKESSLRGARSMSASPHMSKSKRQSRSMIRAPGSYNGLLLPQNKTNNRATPTELQKTKKQCDRADRPRSSSPYDKHGSHSTDTTLDSDEESEEEESDVRRDLKSTAARNSEQDTAVIEAKAERLAELRKTWLKANNPLVNQYHPF